MAPDAAFCNKCGAKAAQLDSNSMPEINEASLPDQTKKPIEVLEEAPVAVKPTPTPQPAPAPTTKPKKKKSKKLIIGIVWLALIVIGIIAVSFGENGEPDLVRVVLNVSPMTEHGFDATYGDMFGWLMENRRTSIDSRGGGVAHIEFSGNVTGGEYEVSIVIAMSGLNVDSEGVRIIPLYMTLNGVDVPDFNNHEGMLMELFWGHHNRSDFATFMDLAEHDLELWANAGIPHYGIFGIFGFGGSAVGVNQEAGQPPATIATAPAQPAVTTPVPSPPAVTGNLNQRLIGVWDWNEHWPGMEGAIVLYDDGRYSWMGVYYGVAGYRWSSNMGVVYFTFEGETFEWFSYQFETEDILLITYANEPGVVYRLERWGSSVAQAADPINVASQLLLGNWRSYRRVLWHRDVSHFEAYSQLRFDASGTGDVGGANFDWTIVECDFVASSYLLEIDYRHQRSQWFYILEITSDKLVLYEAEQSNTYTFVRDNVGAGTPPTTPSPPVVSNNNLDTRLVGTWEYPDIGYGYEFFADGTGSNLWTGERIEWEINGSDLIVTYDHGEVIFRFEIIGNELHIQGWWQDAPEIWIRVN